MLVHHNSCLLYTIVSKCPILFIPSLLFVYYLIFILLETLQSIYLPFYLIVMAGVGKIINFCQIFKSC
jgi:hypothetical protein